MAQVITEDDLGKDKNNQPGQNSSLDTPQASTGPSSGQGQVNAQGPAQAGASTSYNPNQQRGSGYTNIQRIVQANQNNRLGQAVGGGIQQAGDQTRQAIGQAQNQFQQQSQQNRADTTQNQQLVQNVLANPDQYTQGNQGSQFQKLLSGVYQGPTGLQNAQQLQAQAQDVNQLGQAIGTQGGQMGLLQRFVGNPQYQVGQQRLDSLLLGQTGAPALQQAKRSALGLQAQTGNAISGAEQQAKELAGKTQAFGQAAQNQFGQSVSGLESGLQQKANVEQQQRDAATNALLGQLGQGNLSSDVAQQLGIQSGALNYGIDPTKFVTPSAVKASEQNVASAQDYAKLDALRQLSGQYAPQQAQQILGKFAGQNSQAGALNSAQPYAFDVPGLTQAYQASAQNYHSQLDPLQSALTDAQNHYNSVMNSNGSGSSLGKTLLGGVVTQNLQKAQKQYNDTLQSLQAAYGTGTFNVLPDGSQGSSS